MAYHAEIQHKTNVVHAIVFLCRQNDSIQLIGDYFDSLYVSLKNASLLNIS